MLQIACLQYHTPAVFQMIMQIIITKKIKRFSGLTTCLVTGFPAALHPAEAGLCVYLFGIQCSSHFYFRASFHLMLALSQLCTFLVVRSSEVIGHYRSYSSHSCPRTPEELWDVITLFGKLHIQSWLKKLLEYRHSQNSVRANET